jgi:hypothetical protein
LLAEEGSSKGISAFGHTLDVAVHQTLGLFGVAATWPDDLPAFQINEFD